MEFGLLGPLHVSDHGREVAIPGGRPRVLLLVLLLHANEVVSSDRLIEALWGEQPPASAGKIVQGYVSQLRRVLDAAVLATRAPGYVLRVQKGQLDLHRFEALVEQARGAPPERAAALLRDALALWRGPPLPELAYETFAQPEIARLEELRLVALEERIAADLTLGRHRELVAELERLVAQEPLRERLRAQLMLALYRAGRQADALAVYADARRRLVEELGIDPSPELQRLERAILNQDPELEPRVAEPPPAPSPPERAPARRRVRKTVTAVFVDLVDSTGLAERLDPEALERLLARFFSEVRAVLEQHGGTVEKFIGDAVMAVFGIPVLHEDDALRAVRAAAETRDRLAALNAELVSSWGVELRTRIGVNTGEVVAGEGLAPATGEAVTVAARLEQGAAEGEILLGERTYRLVAGAVRAVPVEPIHGKGMAQPVRAWRLLEAPAEAPVAILSETPFVGRERELAALCDAFAARGLWTIVAPAGTGKSRLARELIRALGADARVVVGRCLSYGEGITYWPVREIVRQVVGDEGRAGLAALLTGDEDAEVIADRVAGVAGLGPASGSIAEAHWAVRRLLETLALERPLLVLLEDLHWAEPTLLDLVEYLAGFIREAPVLLLATARPELLEARPTWGTTGTLLALEPLGWEEVDTLIETRGSPVRRDVRARVIEVAEGNPLFVEQLLALYEEEGADGKLPMPPTIQALLAARVDRLEPAERSALERAAVEGRVFHRGIVDELSPADERPALSATLMALVRKGLAGPARSEFPGDDGFRFAHALVRDAVYESVPKELRADLHERMAELLERRAGERIQEYDEIVAYHLEQAYRYRAQIGPLDDRARELAARAGARLAVTGGRASARADNPAAISQLERAVELLPDGIARLDARLELAGTLFRGGEFHRAYELYGELAEAARAAGDRRRELRATVERATARLRIDPAARADEVETIAREAIAELERFGDDRGLAAAWWAVADAYSLRGQYALHRPAVERALAHAERGGAERQTLELRAQLLGELLWGPTAVEEALERAEELLRAGRGAYRLRGAYSRVRAALEAMRGNFDEAHELLARGREIPEELGDFWGIVGWAQIAPVVELLAGDPAAAEAAMRPVCEELERRGETGALSTTVGQLAEALYEQGRYEEAQEAVDHATRIGPADDVGTHAIYRRVGAKLLARRGELERAVALAREAAALVEGKDSFMYADVFRDLGEVLHAAGRDDEAAAAFGEALRRYEQKGNVVAAERTRAMAAGLAGVAGGAD